MINFFIYVISLFLGSNAENNLKNGQEGITTTVEQAKPDSFFHS